MNEQEIWIDIKNFDGKYSVSNFGRVKSNYYIWKNQFGFSGRINKGKIFNLNKDSRGYFHVSLFYGISRTRFRVHSLVAMHFIPNPLGLGFINHKDGVKINNNHSNLEWVTHAQNMNHAWQNGLMEPARPTGEKHHKAKITEKDVLQIRDSVINFKNNKVKYLLAEKYNVTIMTINDILRRRSWKRI